MGISVSRLKEKYVKLPLPLKASMVFTVCSVFQRGVSFIAVPIYTRLVPQEQYGIYSLYQSWDQILMIFATLNMWNYLYSNGMIKYENRKDEFTSALLGLSFVTTSILLIIFILARNLFIRLSGLPLSVLLLLFAGFYLRPGFEYWSARQRFEYDVKKFAMASILIAVTQPVASIGLIMAVRNMKDANLGVALIAGKVLCGGLVYAIVTGSLGKKCHMFFDREIWKFALKFNLPLVPHFLSLVILTQLDRIMIGAICGKAEAAISGVAHSVGAIMLIVNNAVMNSLVPWTYKKLREKNYDKLPMVGSVSLGLVAGLNTITAICAPEIVAIMAPQEYYMAAYVIPPLAMSNVFMFMFNLYANIEYFHEKTKFVAAASCISALVNIVLNYIFINRYGFIAAGYTTLVCYVIYGFSHYCFTKSVLKIAGIGEKVYNNRLLWIIGGLAAGMSLVVIVLFPYRFIRFTILAGSLFIVIVFRKKFFGIVEILRK